jgi:DNA repair ATPase RecN
MVQACLQVQKAVLFTGTTGVGKSVIVSGALERLRGTKTVVPYTVNFSAQTQAMDTQVASQPLLFTCHMHALTCWLTTIQAYNLAKCALRHS